MVRGTVRRTPRSPRGGHRRPRFGAVSRVLSAVARRIVLRVQRSRCVCTRAARRDSPRTPHACASWRGLEGEVHQQLDACRSARVGCGERPRAKYVFYADCKVREARDHSDRTGLGQLATRCLFEFESEAPTARHRHRPRRFAALPKRGRAALCNREDRARRERSIRPRRSEVHARDSDSDDRRADASSGLAPRRRLQFREAVGRARSADTRIAPEALHPLGIATVYGHDATTRHATRSWRGRRVERGDGHAVLVLRASIVEARVSEHATTAHTRGARCGGTRRGAVHMADATVRRIACRSRACTSRPRFIHVAGCAARTPAALGRRRRHRDRALAVEAAVRVSRGGDGGRTWRRAHADAVDSPRRASVLRVARPTDHEGQQERERATHRNDDTKAACRVGGH